MCFKNIFEIEYKRLYIQLKYAKDDIHVCTLCFLHYVFQ